MTREARFSAAHGALRTVAVTGTNGKTTTVSCLEAVVGAAGEARARLTTLGAWVEGQRVMASSAAEEFLLTVEGAVRAGVRTLALETTSKALAAGLATRWPAEVAVFTNLTRDHLDMHESPEAYLAAKAQLFVHLPPGGVAVLNADDPASALLAEVVPEHATVEWFSATGGEARLAASDVRVSRDGTAVTLADSELARELGGELTLAMHGAVHAQNALAAALAASALGYSGTMIRAGLEAFPGVPGRFEVVCREPFTVVDYAHTPDALEGTLDTARRLAGGARVLLVFGCGGERDQGKRPLMGAAAHRWADTVVLTSDNPRGEAAQAIANAIGAGVHGLGATWHVELDRRRAIERAVRAAAPGDVVVVAGKGHEHEQTIGTETRAFDDRQVALAALELRDPPPGQ